MSLRRVPENYEVTDIPNRFRRQFNLWVGRLNQTQIRNIEEHLNRMLDEVAALPARRRYCNASWLPGDDWRGTPLQDIYAVACDENEEQAGWCYGLMLMRAVINRTGEDWCCYKDYDSENITGTFYYLP